MPHAIGDHALLADSRTAALIDPDGGVAWLCWPRVDSAPLLMPLLDAERGGVFSLRVRGGVVESQRHVEAALVVRTLWRTAAALVTVEDALVNTDAPALVRAVRSEGGECEVDIAFAPASALDEGVTLRIDGPAATVAGNGRRVVVTAPADWVRRGPVASCVVRMQPGDTVTVTLQDEDARRPVAADAIAGTIRGWRERLAGIGDVAVAGAAEQVLGSRVCRDLLTTSAAVLVGLRNLAGGSVAAPTTSLPQWPGTSRCWDYRYCWLRDSALAALAMLRLRLVADAHSLAGFLGEAVLAHGVHPVFRVDGGTPPPETEHPQVAGYEGARPVRTGNAAARQLQVDVAGELLELAEALDRFGVLPESLRDAAPLLADWIAGHWTAADHGIWEIRGQPRHYTHSRLAAWSGLGAACELARRGRVAPDPSWAGTRPAIRRALLGSPGGPLQLHEAGGGADAALCLVAGGLLAPDDPLCLATLDLIDARLDRAGILARHEPQPDEMPEPCGPFVFPTFWMATAEQRTGRDWGPRLRAAVSASGRHGLFGEVADASGRPLGNYPQVQSHAACVLALTDETPLNRSS